MMAPVKIKLFMTRWIWFVGKLLEMVGSLTEILGIGRARECGVMLLADTAIWE
jgi:hypothetical protein